MVRVSPRWLFWLLLYKLIGWAVNNGCKCFDFMAGKADYKSRFANEQCELADFTIPGSMRGRILEPVLARCHFSFSHNTLEGANAEV